MVLLFRHRYREWSKKKIERKGGALEKEAHAALRKAITNYENGFIDPPKETVSMHLENWVENFVKENRKINTYNRYKEIIKNNINPNMGSILMKNIKPIHVETMLLKEKKEKGLSGTTLQTIYGVLSAAFNRSVKLQIIQSNPCKFVDRPKREKFIATTLDIDEFNTVLNSIDDSKYIGYIIKIGLMIVLELGLRRGKLGGLELENIDFKNHCIYVRNNLIYSKGHVYLGSTKTDGSERTLYVSDDILKVFEDHKKIQFKNTDKYGVNKVKNTFNDRDCNFVMTWPNGQYVHPNYYTSKFKKVLANVNLGKHIRFHDLRHSNATLMLQQETDFKTIQVRLGHENITTTMNIYSHVNLEMQKKASGKLSDLIYGGKPVEEKNKNTQ